MFVPIVIILASAAGIWLFSSILSKGTDALGVRFRIDPGVRGATLDAVASSFPELCAVVFALIAGSFDAGIGTIVGSALYNILVIPALSVLVGGVLRVQKSVVRRDGFLYLAVVVGLIAAAWLGPTSGHDNQHFLSPWLGVVSMSVYLAYIFVLVRHARAKRTEPQTKAEATGSSVQKSSKRPVFSPWKVSAQLLFGVAGIGLATHFLVESSLALFKIIHLSEAVAGVTVLAAATSLPDTLLSVFAVRRGDADGAVSNAFGSNSFDILVGLGLPIAVVGGVGVNWVASRWLLGFLLVSTVGTVGFLLSGFRLNRLEAAIMGLTYVAFTGLALAGLL